jgi:PAS domain S-box-containing protein
MLAQPRTDAPTLQKIWSIFGSPSDPMLALEARAREILPDLPLILWEGDAATFHFAYVSPQAEALLGYPARRWTEEPTFWADIVVHPGDRNDAVAFCAVATGQCRDHDFVYRARTADGRVVWLHDVVRVIRGARDIPERLRGVMLDVTPAFSPAPEMLPVDAPAS